MRELHAVVYSLKDIAPSELKQRLILFDSFAVIDRRGEVTNLHEADLAALHFLEEKGIVCTPPKVHVSFTLTSVMPPDPQEREEIAQDIMVRVFAAAMAANGQDVVGICKRPPSDVFEFLPAMPDRSRIEDAIQVALEAFPMPDDGAALDDIINFKTDLQDKHWDFRRFLRTLATKQQTEGEVRDEIEWLVKEYTKAMQVHRLKASNSFADVFLLSPLEIIEDLVKLNWSKLARGAMSVKKRKVELLEAEMKAPGRECAYVFEARKRFARKR